MVRTTDREELKARSEQVLQARGVAINTNLPLLETDDELRVVPPGDVARRFLVVSQVIGVGFNAPRSQLVEYLHLHGLWEDVSANERRMLTCSEPTEQDRIDASWLTEAAQALVWCLGRREDDPWSPCDDDLVEEVPRPDDVAAFVASARLRHRAEIVATADLYYRLHWAIRNARLYGTKPPASESIVRERRRALDWVLGTESDWDEVPLDT